DAGAPLPESRLLHFEELEIAFRLTKASFLYVGELGLSPFALASDYERVAALRSVKHALKRLPQADRARLHAAILTELRALPDEIAAYAARFSKFRKLSADQIRELARAGCTIGGDTRTHRPLSSLSPEELRREIAGNFRDLQTAFALSAIPFAYPYGTPELTPDAARAAAEQSGFECAFTTTTGENLPETPRFQLRRYGDTELMAELTLGGDLAGVR